MQDETLATVVACLSIVAVLLAYAVAILVCDRFRLPKPTPPPAPTPEVIQGEPVDEEEYAEWEADADWWKNPQPPTSP